MTRYFYDTEFLEDGRTIELISIGIVADDGREFYAVSEEADRSPLSDAIARHPWLMANVVPHLPLKPGFTQLMPKGKYPGSFILDDTDNAVMPRRMIRNAVREFLNQGPGRVELWADYAAYDHVALCQLFGTMMQLPANIPMFTNDIQQLWHIADRPDLPPGPTDDAHNALADARHAKACYDAISASFSIKVG